MHPSFAHRITKYNPADRDEHGHYIGAEDTESDHGPVEAAYLEAIAAFAQESGIDLLEIREPQVAGFVGFGLETSVDGHGLAGLFPSDLTGYYDGAEVSVPVALELVRAMLRDQGAWCRLEQRNTFTVHVGWDQYVYVGSDQPCEAAIAHTKADLGVLDSAAQHLGPLATAQGAQASERSPSQVPSEMDAFGVHGETREDRSESA
ncbi:hypothetical protein [Streptomyces sp. NPDC048663]|uniref:hypothetical protein n=1 Tax=Streptomyces sp. NPDC048663 TaxID=3155638 RepID=UPI00342689FB